MEDGKSNTHPWLDAKRTETATPCHIYSEHGAQNKRSARDRLWGAGEYVVMVGAIPMDRRCFIWMLKATSNNSQSQA